jgi:signal transduction histidine kinase
MPTSAAAGSTGPGTHSKAAEADWRGTPAPAGGDGDSGFEASAFEAGPDGSAGPADADRRIKQRRGALVLLALLGCLGVFVLAHWLAGTPYLDSQWSATPQGRLLMHASAHPALSRMGGQTLQTLAAPDGEPVPVDFSLLQRSPRWQVSDGLRARMAGQHQTLSAALAAGRVTMQFAGGATIEAVATPRGYTGLGWMFWMLAASALVLYLVGWVVALANPLLYNQLFLLMSLCHAVNLIAIATETLPGLGVPYRLLVLDLPLRLALDACTGAAIVHAFALYPTRLAFAPRLAWAVWPTAVLAAAAVASGWLPAAWWWSQGVILSLGLLAWLVARRSYAVEPNPFALAMTRFAITSVATLLLMSAAVALSAHLPGLAHGVAVGASITWYLFLGSLLVLVPFLAGSRRVLREFALLAGISTVATSLDLLFVSVLSFGPFVSLAISASVALLLYGGARQFILSRVLGSNMLTTERIFDHLYRAARALQSTPERYPLLLAQLLRDLFDPLLMKRVARTPSRSRVVNGGAALVIPVVQRHAGPSRGERAPAHALMLRFAQRGQRLFTDDDARLAERVIDQLHRAVAYDLAVETGRSEERTRIAQDLHDDIGARLLTLMYQAPTPEMEDYIRHTLQDLKTLTRGLAAPAQTLSHAAGEWKADLAQRLTAARAELVWSLSIDHDLRLTVVQWSALTRILRELVSNSLYHGHATRVEVAIDLAGSRLRLRVTDDGRGRAPQAWAHGLGLGGVRKRVKALAGRVAWSEATGDGISCLVEVPDFDHGARDRLSAAH